MASEEEERESSFYDKSLPTNISRAIFSQKQKSLFCDIIMRICGTEVHAHSVLLAAASPYFSSFLSQDLPRQFSQRSPQIIEIQIEGSDSNANYADAVTSVIDFIYTGVIHIKASTVVQVSELARIMQLDQVSQFCHEFIVNRDKTAQADESNVNLIKSTDRGMNTDILDFDVTNLLSKKVLGPAGSQIKSKTGAVMPLGGRSLFVHPVSSLGPQKLFKAGKLVSTSTQVTPSLLGIHLPPPKETKECKTQTLDRDFPDKSRLHHLRSGRRRQHSQASRQQPVRVDEKNSESEIVMEITRTKFKPTSVRVIKQESKETPSEDLRVHIDTDGNLRVSDERALDNNADTEGIFDMSYDAENEELFELFSGNDCSRRRSGRRPKPTPKIIALRRQGGPVKVKQATTIDEVQEPPQEPEVVNTKEKELPEKSPRKTKLKPREDDLSECIEEETVTEKDIPEMPLETKTDEQVPEAADEAENPNVQEAAPVTDVISRLCSRKKPAVRMRRGKRTFKKFVCSECNFQTNKVREFTCHKGLHKMENNICYYCDEKFLTKEELNEHFDKHKGPLPYFCHVCDVRYKSKTQLNIHLPKHSQVKPFVCEVCSAGFKWKHALKNHMIVHSNRKDHLCDQCGYATAHKCQLKAHKLIHTGETFRCPISDCRFQATKRQNLKYHLLTHTREKPHQCEICGQSFSLIKNMRRHMLLHSTDKPHHCDQCDFSTTRFDKLKEHMLKLHGMGSPPEKRIRVADLVQDYTGLPDPNVLEPGVALTDNPQLSEEEDFEVGGGIVAPLVAASGPIPMTTEDLIRATSAGGVIGDSQTMQFVPGQTIIIAPSGQDGEMQAHEVTIPNATNLLETVSCEQVQSTMQFTEVMIPTGQLSDYVQELTFVPQT